MHATPELSPLPLHTRQGIRQVSTPLASVAGVAYGDGHADAAADEARHVPARWCFVLAE